MATVPPLPRSAPLTAVRSLAFLGWRLSGALTEASCPVLVTSVLGRLLPAAACWVQEPHTQAPLSPPIFTELPPHLQKGRVDSLDLIPSPRSWREEATSRVVVGGVEMQFLRIDSFLQTTEQIHLPAGETQ